MWSQQKNTFVRSRRRVLTLRVPRKEFTKQRMDYLGVTLAYGASGVAATYLIHAFRNKGGERRQCTTTLVDPRCEDDVVRLVRAVSSSSRSTDDLAERLERLFVRFPPTQTTLTCLNCIYDRFRGTGGEQEFCVVTVLAVLRFSPWSPPPVVSSTRHWHRARTSDALRTPKIVRSHSCSSVATPRRIETIPRIPTSTAVVSEARTDPEPHHRAWRCKQAHRERSH